MLCEQNTNVRDQDAAYHEHAQNVEEDRLFSIQLSDVLGAAQRQLLAQFLNDRKGILTHGLHFHSVSDMGTSKALPRC